jgi:hypothetical protein
VKSEKSNEWREFTNIEDASSATEWRHIGRKKITNKPAPEQYY